MPAINVCRTGTGTVLLCLEVTTALLLLFIEKKNAVTSLKYFISHKSACKDSLLLFSSCISMKNERNEIKLYRGQQQGSKSKNVKPAFLLPALYSGLESH